MSIFSNPFDSSIRLSCSCGEHSSQVEHDKAVEGFSNKDEQLLSNIVDQAVMRALFPADDLRRKFLQAVGAPTAMAAVA